MIAGVSHQRPSRRLPRPAPTPRAWPPGSSSRSGPSAQHDARPRSYGERPAERDLSPSLFSGLVKPGPGRPIQPDLATSWHVTTTAELDVRPPRRCPWHDGRPVTADDVVFTVRLPAAPGLRRAVWRPVSWPRPSNAHRRPGPFRPAAAAGLFLSRATQPSFRRICWPPSRCRRRSTAFASAGRHGPFRLASVGDDQVILERAGPPPGGAPAAIPATPSDSGTAHAGGARRRHAAASRRPGVGAVSVAAALAGRRSGRCRRRRRPAGDRRTFAGCRRPRGSRIRPRPDGRVLNLRDEPSPFRDATVRRALLQAVDREGLVAEVMGGHGVIVDVPLAGLAALWHDADGAGVPTTRPRRARRSRTPAGRRSAAFWQPSGAKDPFRVQVVTSTPAANPQLHAAADQFVAAWKDLRHQGHIEGVPAGRFIEGLCVGRLRCRRRRDGHRTRPRSVPVAGFGPGRHRRLEPVRLPVARLDGLLSAARTAWCDRRGEFAELRRAPGPAAVPAALPRRPYRGGHERLEGPRPRLISSPSDRFGMC